MSSSRSDPIRVDQCLFGYDDGHQLLAGSTSLPANLTSLLLMLSDLAPGVTHLTDEGYWTGVTLPGARIYALLRTWPAPELPRPGCVWTHALLIRFVDIARFADLGMIRTLTARPHPGARFEAYSEPLLLDVAQLRATHQPKINDRDGLRLIRAVYGAQAPVRTEASPGALDDSIFALWSQQWPRLRRTFSFRTASGTVESRIPGVRFDLQVVPRLGNEASLTSEVQFEVDADNRWELVALKDLLNTKPTEFRRFIWRYGSDMRQGRERFRFLAQLYPESRSVVLAGAQLASTLEMVAAALPDLDDGRTLKKDLVSCGQNAYSLLPPCDPINMLTFFTSGSELTAFPPPPHSAVEMIRTLWPTRVSEILALGERVADRRSQLNDAIIDQLAAVVDSGRFLAMMHPYHCLRGRLVRMNPSLLDTDALVTVAQPDLSELLRLIPDDEAVVRPLLGRVVVLDDAKLAREMFERFPDMTMQIVATAMEHAVAETGTDVSSAWLQLISANRIFVLRAGLVEVARSTGVLAMYANLLGYTNADVIAIGPEPWVKALRQSRDDVGGRDRQMLLAFLLAIALQRPLPGCELLFERTFEPIHRDLAASRLPEEAFALLAPHLPVLSGVDQWDTCLQLRMAIVDAYVQHGLDPSSFRRLTYTRWLFEELAALAKHTYRGRRFVRRAFGPKWRITSS